MLQIPIPWACTEPTQTEQQEREMAGRIALVVFTIAVLFWAQAQAQACITPDGREVAEAAEPDRRRRRSPPRPPAPRPRHSPPPPPRRNDDHRPLPAAVDFHHCAPIGLDAGWLLAHQHGEMASFHFTLLIVLSLTFSLLRGRGSVLVACHASG
jgi:hypothetical protein